RKSDTKLIRDWAKRANNWKSPEQLIEAMFSLSRYPSLDGPLQVYLTLVEVDRRRPAQQQLRPATVRLMADKFSRFRDQYPLFSEFSDLDDAAITRFLAVAEAVDKISDKAVKANT